MSNRAFLEAEVATLTQILEELPADSILERIGYEHRLDKVRAELCVEHMAESAHDAWWNAQKLEGTTSRKAAWGEEFMVPFDQLSERGREFDRVIMRAILRSLDAQGYSVIPKS